MEAVEGRGVKIGSRAMEAVEGRAQQDKTNFTVNKKYSPIVKIIMHRRGEIGQFVVNHRGE